MNEEIRNHTDLPPLIPRTVLFGNPVKATPQISPDGRHLAYLAPSEQGVLNIWVRSLGQRDDHLVTHETHRPITTYFWAYDDRHLLYTQDNKGDENTHVFALDLQTHIVRDLTPFVGIRATNVLTDSRHPSTILVGLNLRDRRLFDMYRVDLTTGAMSLEAENPGDVLAWTADANFVIRAATVFDPEEATTLLRVRESKNAPWRDLLVSPFTDSPIFGQMNGSSLIAGFRADGRALYAVSPLGADTTRLVMLDATTGQELAEIASHLHSDVDVTFRPGGGMCPRVLLDPTNGRVQAVGFNYQKPEWQMVDPALREDFEVLGNAHPGGFSVESRDRADQIWTVSYVTDDGPTAYYLYDRAVKRTLPLFTDRPALADYRLAQMRPLTLTARDGFSLLAYLTLPPGVRAQNLPLVLYPHGGPWFRDFWGFDPVAQLLANRGYAVLQVAFRGSAGLGKTYLNAGTGEWGVGKMQHDLTDAVRWAIHEGIANPKRVGILGGSYGGYATLAGVTFTQELYACAVDLVGPSEVKYLFASMPVYWAPVKKRWALRVGDVEHDEELNRRISPLYHVDAIQAPLLIGHGANDPRVALHHSERIVNVMREKNLHVTFVVYPDEGHGFERPENNLDFFGRVEKFLAQHLGGRAEPWELVPGSTAEVR